MTVAAANTHNPDSLCLRENERHPSHQAIDDSEMKNHAPEPPIIAQISEADRELSTPHQTRNNEEQIRREQIKKSVRALIDNLTASTGELNDRIKMVLDEQEIEFHAKDKLRVEIDDAGKIFVSGIRDSKKIKIVEAVLNDDAGRSKKMQTCKADRQELSRILSGEIGKSFREICGELAKNPDHFALAASPNSGIANNKKNTRSSAVSTVADDRNSSSLTTLDSIFCGEPEMAAAFQKLGGKDNQFTIAPDNIIAQPEEVIKDFSKHLYHEIGDLFYKYNYTGDTRQQWKGIIPLLKTTKSEDMMLEPDFAQKYLLNINSLRLTITRENGKDKINVEVNGDKKTCAIGVQIVKDLFAETAVTTDELDRENIFTTATNRLLENYQAEFGDEATNDAAVQLKIGGDAGAQGKVRLASESKEAELLGNINQEFNARLNEMLQNAGKESPAPSLKVEITDSGKLQITNLSENTDPQPPEILPLLDFINEQLIVTADDDKQFGKLKNLIKHRRQFSFAATSGASNLIRTFGGLLENSPAILPAN